MYVVCSVWFLYFQTVEHKHTIFGIHWWSLQARSKWCSCLWYAHELFSFNTYQMKRSAAVRNASTFYGRLSRQHINGGYCILPACRIARRWHLLPLVPVFTEFAFSSLFQWAKPGVSPAQKIGNASLADSRCDFPIFFQSPKIWNTPIPLRSKSRNNYQLTSCLLADEKLKR